MQGVRIRAVEKLGEDARGSTFEFQTKKTGAFLLIERKAGTISGNAYHEGKNVGTAPKTFIVVSGEIALLCRQVNTETVERFDVVAPAIIEVDPYITHAVLGVTNFVMLEANSIQDIREDRVLEPVELVI